MSTVTVNPIPYDQNSALLFDKIQHLDWAIFLDSANSHHPKSRYDILTALPDIKISTLENTTQVQEAKNSIRAEVRDYKTLYESTIDPLSIVETEFQRWKLSKDTNSILSKLTDFGVLPGLYGYFGYDLGRRFESIPETSERDIALPELSCGIYSWIILVDHKSQRSHLISLSSSPNCQWILRLLNKKHASVNSFQLTKDWKSNLPKDHYQSAFQKIKSHIQKGNCYQINLTHRLSNHFQGSPWLAYKALRQRNPNPFSAFLNLGNHQILSFSPEQFIQVRDGIAQTRPIKGTSPRDENPSIDAHLAEQLTRSEKNRAENLMIVDLLRNDFSKRCIPHSVKVPALFDLESFPTVHHLVSTVVGELPPSLSPLKLMKSCFPGGSITGAPKIKAMQIIEETEPQRRSIYCGSILYLDIAGRLDSSITIRTMLCELNRIYCWAGGGIVADSISEEEYQETFDKIKGLLDGLN
ncbi:MAG: aminodeoxychorismate synthase component I [Pseudomonadales bacterium]|nr:aminodeoxychorismate synthase component I [Pseudomonadales bacterium]